MSIETVEIFSEPYKGYVLQGVPDPDPQNPLTFGTTLTTFACYHRRYSLGHPVEVKSKDYGGWSELKAALVKRYKPVFISPLYMYDHSGLAFALSPFGCPWDSGQLGYAFVTRASRLAYFGRVKSKTVTQEQLHDIVTSELASYAAYVNGDVYSINILRPVDDDESELVDSIDGLYDIEAGKEEARKRVDTLLPA